MKTLLFLFLLVTQLSILARAQKTFLRIYNSSGKKVLRGFYGGATDSSVYVYKSKTDSSMNIYKNKEKVEMLISDISVIRTRRSVGRNTDRRFSRRSNAWHFRLPFRRRTSSRFLTFFIRKFNGSAAEKAQNLIKLE